MLRRAVAACILAQLFCAAALLGDITSATLQIQGVSLEVETTSVTTPIDVGTTIRTKFGGKSGDATPSVEGLLAVGDLTGPALDAPIQLTTAPGYPFQIPGLKAGVYVLANIRLMKGTEFVAPAAPSMATITVADILQTTVKVRQLTVEELRARGIHLDSSWIAWQFSFSFMVNGSEVVVPFPVAIDPRTHEVKPIAKETPYTLPPAGSVQPPRWSPPDVVVFDLPVDEGAFEASPGADSRDRTVKPKRVSIPAAIVIPNSLAALHEFFAVMVTVANGAPAGSTARLENVSGTIKLPSALRVAKSQPSVSFGQPVPVVDATTGVTFLVAQAKGEAEWDVEGLAPGTHTVDIEVRATLREIGQPDIPLKATPRASVVVHDPRFNLTFSHPDVVRRGVDYVTYSFLTNTSAASQTVRLRNGVPSCDQAPGANVCRTAGADMDELTLTPGEMRVIEYRLRPGVTGQVFATAGSVAGDAITAAVELHMGVSESGIPLSPSTLILPYYAQFLSAPVLEANLQLLGLGYSLATAPVNQTTAKLPRVIRSDVFYRAVDIGRAGQRIFISEGAVDQKFDAMASLTLDLLGNALELREWDELRRRDASGRKAMAPLFAELNATGMAGRSTLGELADRFAVATAFRSPFAMAIVHGPAVAGNAMPYAIEIRGASGRRMAIANEADSGWTRDLPFGDVSRFDVPTLGRSGEIAVVGRWSETLDVIVTPAVSGSIAIELVFPATADGSALRAHFDINAAAGEALRIPLSRGATTLNAILPGGGFAATTTATPVALAPLNLVAGRQDLHLDPEGHQVSMLFSRPISVQDGVDLRTKFSGRIAFNRDGVAYDGARPIFAASLQDGARIVNLSFDHVLTTNAAYDIAVSPLLDGATRVETAFVGSVKPKIDNDRPAGIVYGKFLKGDNTPIGAAEVRMYTGHFRGCEVGLLDGDPAIDCNPYREAPQYARTEADGTFLFEYVPRDVVADPELNGGYRLLGVASSGRFTIVDGAVRLPGRVQFVNLQLLGRGAAEGVVRYDNGDKVANADVFAGSTMFNIGRSARTDASGTFRVEDLPVGPITLSATDAAGNVAFAAAEIPAPGQVVSKDLLIVRRPFPGTGSVFGVVRRSDTNQPAAGARVGVYSQGFAVAEAMTDSAGRFEFRRVPAGFVTVLAADWSIGRESAAADFDLRADETHEANLTLAVQSASEPVTTLTGEVIRENPLYPGDPTKYERVSGALVKIGTQAALPADANGHFVVASLPLSASGSIVQAYDPVTKRIGQAVAPTLTEPGPNNVSIFIPANAYGKGTVRVKLLDAAGNPVSGFRVIEPGYPPTRFTDTGSGVYEQKDVPVGGSVDIWAVSGPAPFGDQYAHTTARVEFAGQVVAATMRLPGQGKVRVKLHADFDLIDNVNLSYAAWEEAEQALSPRTVTASTSENGVAGYATFSGVPALAPYKAEVMNAAHGYAAAGGTLAYDGDVATHTLQLSRLATIRGTVYAIDGTTPIAGAAVKLDDGRRDTGVQYSQPDGSFTYTDVPAGVFFRITADVTQSGIYRTGAAYGRTPDAGGPVDGMSVMLRRRGSVEGRVVYAGYRKFDPNNPANNIADDTPGDLSDNAPVPLAKLWMRELDFPNRSFGSDADPVSADASGRFAFSNVFAGGLRASAWDPANQELRGDWTATLQDEGQVLGNVTIAIGAAGTGSIQATVVDPNQSFAVVANAEVSVFRGGTLFDLTSSDGNGSARFEQLPAGSYSVNAYSKSLGKSGSSGSLTVQKDLVSDTRIILSFSGKVDGTLTDPETAPPGRGVPGAPVTLSGAGYQTRASTAPAGAFSFDGVREGTFTLDGKDTVSNRRATATRALSAADPHPIVSLELERTDTLYLGVYLPDDTGGNSGILAGPVAVDVTQRSGDFVRSTQGNPITVNGMLVAAPYAIVLREIGGAGRQLTTSGSFPRGSAADPLKLVYPAHGDVIVTVTQGGAPAVGAKVMVGGTGKVVSLVTDATGEVTAHEIPIGAVSAQATSVDGAFSGSSAGLLQRQSVPARMVIDLGAYAGITGTVEAEAGGASIGTRVVASFAGRTLEVLTDSDGRYTFRGIPTTAPGTIVALTYVGPDGVTIGARQSVTITAADASRVVVAPAVRLDATPPQLISITPLDGAQNVSPDSAVRLVFTEQLRADQVSNTYLQLVPADGTGQVMATFDAPVVAADGTFVITMRAPPPPAGQRFPLRSNTLYRVIVSGAVEDLTGHTIAAARGTTFTTSDYNEPRVIRTVPPAGSPLPEQVTLQFIFNEPIDTVPWQAGGSGVFHLYKVSVPRAEGTVIGEVIGHAYVDPSAAATLVFAPDASVAPDSYYRAVFSGIRDLQGNAAPEQTFYFASRDGTKPYVRLVSPVPDGLALISGVEYILGVDILNGSANAPPAEDVAKVDYVRVDGAAETYLTTVTKPPFGYRFVAPEAPETGSTLTLRARATDTSSNTSDPATSSWTVKPNAAPQKVVITAPPPPVYPASTVSASVAFDDEGTLLQVSLTLTTFRLNGVASSDAQTKQVTRSSVAVPWSAAQFAFVIPADVDASKPAKLTASVTDVRGLSTATTLEFAVAPDTVRPAILSMAPAAETAFHLNDRYVVEAVVSDSESGVAEVVFTADGQTYHVVAAAAVSGPSPGSRKFTSPQIIVPAKNVDTRIGVAVTALDYAGNSTTRTFEVIYVGVNDPAIPTGFWICPIDRAVLPSNTAVALPLRVRATDDIAVTAVKFRVQGLAELVTATRVGTSDEYQGVAATTTPAAGADFSVVAIINDADSTHTVEMPIAIDIIAVDQVIDATVAITADNKAQFDGKSVIVRSAAGRLVPHVPLLLQNLLVMDGAKVESLATTTSLEQRADITVADRLYVDCASSIDVTGKGYLGGWGVNADGSGTRNDSPSGRTRGNSNAGGAVNAGGSHGGLGAAGLTGIANAVYDALGDPAEPGSGGSGAATCCIPGGAGGGAIALGTDSASTAIGRIVVAGSIHADGGGGAGYHRGGSGGSVRLRARQLIVGPSARVTANGGDAPPADGDGQVGGSGGGGRIAVMATDRLDLPSLLTQFEARGGNTPVPTQFLRGGAGTIYLRRPGVADASLYVASAPAGQPARSTPVGFVGTGTATTVTPYSLTDSSRVFDIASTGEEILFSSTPAKTFRVTAVSTDGHTLTTDPADGDLTAIATAGSAYRGLVRFGEIHAGANALVRFDESFAAAAVVDDRAAIDRDSSATVVLHSDKPQVAIASTSPAGPNLYRRTALDVALDGSSFAGVSTVSVELAPVASPVVANVPGYPTAVTARHTSVSIGAGAPLGAATLDVRLTDRADRVATASRNFTIAADAGRPVVTILSPVPPVVYQEQTGATFVIRATAVDAEVGVKSVIAKVGDAAAVPMSQDASGNWTVTVPVPNVDGTSVVTIAVTVSATDYEDNVGSASVNIGVQPLIDPNAPQISWACPSDGAMLPAGYSPKLRVFAKGQTTSNGVQKVEFFIGASSSTAIPAVAVGSDYYESVCGASGCPMPDVQDGTEVSIRAVATSVGGNVNSASIRAVVVRTTGPSIKADLTIDDTNAATYERKTIVVESGTVTITGPRTFDRLIVLGGTVTHLPADAAQIGRLAINATAVYVACGAAIDVSGRGFSGNLGGTGRTWPNTFSGGSRPGSGGSHGGTGGGPAPAQPYGSLFDPDTPGGGGAISSGDCANCNGGGGIARISVSALVLDGSVLSNGTARQGTAAGGAGGSIRLDANSLTGSGEIHADGGNWDASGGGGRIALYYTTLGLDRAKITARAPGSSGANRGAPGTIFFKQTPAQYGELSISDSELAGSAATRLTSVGIRTVDEAGSDYVRQIGATMLAPDHLRGIRLIVGTDRTQQWPIVSNTAEIVRLDTTARPLIATAGQQFRGLQKFDVITLRNARLQVEDLLESTSLTKDASSSIDGSNAGPPIVDPSRLALQTSPAGPVAAGSAGAISDSDVPVSVIVTNARSGQTFTTAAGPDGSFIVGVQGSAGDSLTLKARDANLFALESAAVPLGVLSTSSPVPATIDRSAWTTDAAFRAQILALEGQRLVVASDAFGGAASSDQAVVLDLAVPGTATLSRVISTGRSAVTDVAISGGVAFIAGYGLATIDLKNPGSAPIAAPGVCGGWLAAVAVTSGYAFVSDAGCYSNGRIYVFDAGNSAALQLVSQNDLAVSTGASHPFTDLLPFGNNYLVGLSDSADGKDVMIFDRSDLRVLRTAGELQIPNFVARKGWIDGKLLYVVGAASNEIVAVDLSTVSAPSIASRLPLPSGGRQVRVIGTNAFVADGPSGLIAATATVPQRITGAAQTGGRAFDVAVSGGYAYVANESGLAILPLAIPPVIDSAQITVALKGSNASITGSRGAISGSIPITAEAGNTRTTTTPIDLQVDGSFTVSVPAAPGDVITVKARNASGTAGPVVVGTVPFGSSTTLIPVTISGDGFRARALQVDGTLLAVSSQPPADSANVVLFDASNPSAPLRLRSVAVASTSINDFAIANGVAYAVQNAPSKVDLSSPAAARVFGPAVCGNALVAVALANGYVFASDSNCYSDGRVYVFDGLDPGSIRLIVQHDLATTGVRHTFTRLLPYGAEYLVALSDSTDGKDVMVFDRRDPMVLREVGEVSIPEVVAFRGMIAGNTLYVAGRDTGIATVDLSTIATPRVIATARTNGIARNLQVAGSTVIVADQAGGVTFFESAGSALRLIGSQDVGGSAWDVALIGTSLYVANDQGLAIINDVALPPDIVPGAITVTSTTATTAAVTGGYHAVAGQPPVQVIATAQKGGASDPINVPASGSFAASLSARQGEAITLAATDGSGRTNAKRVGSVPFFATVSSGLSASSGDASFVARRIASDGTNVAITDGTLYGARPPSLSSRMLLFRQPNASDPPAPATFDPAIGGIADEEIQGRYAFIAADQFAVVDYLATVPTRYVAAHAGGRLYSVAVSGTHAYASPGDSTNDGTILVYDISSPTSPVLAKTARVASSGTIIYRDLFASNGTLYAISPDANRDLTVIDIHTPESPVRVAEWDIPNFAAFAGAIDGTTLYLAGGDAGVAIVDVANPAAPALVKIVDTPGIARAVAVATPGRELVVADGSSGLTFIDTTDKANAFVLGSQPLDGTATDVSVVGSQIYAATETRFYVLARP